MVNKQLKKRNIFSGNREFGDKPQQVNHISSYRKCINCENIYFKEKVISVFPYNVEVICLSCGCVQ